MAKYIIRLDDACEKMNVANWSRMEDLLDKYGIKPLVGIIPNCEDEEMEDYPRDAEFWKTADRWIAKGWTMALHGYNHVYASECGGINPVNRRSEFAGEPLDVQKEKIRSGLEILASHGIEPKVFFAPSYTFDENTITALKECSDIRIISDTVASKPYTKYGMTFVPQQTGKARKLPFNTVTFCYHPNTMKDGDFDFLEKFIIKNKSRFITFPIKEVSRKTSVFDSLLRKLYFARR